MHTKFIVDIRTVFVSLALCVFLLTSVHAEEFPETYIKHSLAEANRGVNVDVTHLKAGQTLSVHYIDRSVLIYRRTKSDLAQLERDPNSGLIDPRNKAFLDSVKHEFDSTSSTVWARLVLAAKKLSNNVPARSFNKEIFVAAAWSPASGCELALVSDAVHTSSDAVFRDPCTGVTFDASGRSILGGAGATRPGAPTFNMSVLPYRVEGSQVIIRPEPNEPLPLLPFSPADLCGNLSPTQNLICAAKYNDINMARKAIRDGADVNYFRWGETSPIDAAITGSSIEVIKLLLQHGARFTPNSERTAQFIHREDVLTMLHGSS